MPWYNIVPRDGDGPISAHAWVPIDDENCWAWSISFNPDKPLTKDQTDHYRRGGSIHAETIPGTYLPTRNADNDYLINRTLQKTVSFTGIHGIAMQDVAMQESMGPIVDRTKEHLGSSDAAVIAARKRLLAEVRAFAEAEGDATPSGLDPLQQRVRSASMILPTDMSWVEATAESRKAAERHYQHT
jgi:hypothetical protein